jgi:hypothetical protein
VGKSGARLVTIAHEPEIRAADATANVDWQTVAFSAILFKGSGDDATIEDQSPWVWDRAPDEQLLDFAGNFWRRFRETGHRQIFFHPAGSGPYRVAIRYHWYAANGSADYDTLDWAKYHFGHFGSASQGYCNFPGPPPPDGHYAGTTDESKNVSFDSAPIWSTVPRDVGGSRLTNVKVSSSISCTPAKTLTYSITVDAGRWIQLNADNTFAYARIGNVNDPSRQNVSASYFLAGKIDTAGSAAGSYYIQQIAFDESGTHYNCTGAPHGWTAAKSG